MKLIEVMARFMEVTGTLTVHGKLPWSERERRETAQAFRDAADRLRRNNAEETAVKYERAAVCVETGTPWTR